MEFAEIKQFFNLPDEVDSIDKFKERFNSSYISKDKAHLDDQVKSKATGDVLRRISSKVANEFSDFGLKTSDFEGKPFEEVLSGVAVNIKTKLSELQEGQGKPDKRTQELEARLNQVNQEREQYKGQLDKVLGEFDQFKATKDNEVKSWKLGIKLKEAKEQVTFKDNMSELERLGFEAKLGEYKFDLDDSDGVVVKDKTGNFIPSKNKAGAFADVVEVLDMLADQSGVKKKNNAQQQTKNTTNQASQTLTKKPATAYYKRLQQFGK